MKKLFKKVKIRVLSDDSFRTCSKLCPHREDKPRTKRMRKWVYCRLFQCYTHILESRRPMIVKQCEDLFRKE